MQRSMIENPRHICYVYKAKYAGKLWIKVFHLQRRLVGRRDVLEHVECGDDVR